MSQIIMPSRKLWTPPQKQRGYVVLDGYRGAGGGGGTWGPPDLTAPAKIWVNDSSSVTDAGGGACAQWNDLSGNSAHFTGDAGTRPTILAAGLNGRRVIRFNGTTHVMLGAHDFGNTVFKNTGQAWCFCVYKKRSTDGSAITRTIFSSVNGMDASSRFVVNAQGSAAVGKPALYVRRLDGDSTSTLNAATDTGTSWRMMLQAMDYSNGDGFIHLDGALDVQNLSLTSSGSTSNTNSTTFIGLGAYFASPVVNHSDVDIAEFIIGSGSLPSAGEIDKIFGYAAHRWGLAGSLDAGHPYKSAPP